MTDTDVNSRIKSKRTVLRTAVTKYCNKIEGTLSEQQIDVVDLEENLAQLINKSEELRMVDTEIETQLTPEEYDREFQSVEDYKEKITKWTFRAQKKIKQLTPNDTSFNATTSVSTIEQNGSGQMTSRGEVNVLLPKLSISKYYGDTSQWLTFWNSFESAIHNNTTLNKIDKFNYLKAHLGADAARSIEGYSISEENYDTVIKLLEDRFGRKDILINTHLNNLLNIPPLKNSNDIKSFRNIYDNCQTQVRSLEALGVDSDNYGTILCPMLLKLLPSDLILSFSKIEDIDSQYKINSLLKFLDKELSAREKSLALVAQTCHDNRSLTIASPPTDRLRRGEEKQNRNKIKTANDLLIKTSHNETCLFCGKTHASENCYFAKKLTLDERKDILMKKGACFRCLNRFHLARYCKNRVICNLCSGNHSSLVCNRETQKVNDKYYDKNVVADKSDLSKENMKISTKIDLGNLSGDSEIYLQTLVLKVKGKYRNYTLRGIYDSGSENSYISKFAAKKLGLQKLNDEVINHCLFGGQELSENHTRYKLNLSNVNETFNCQIEVLDQDTICSEVPRLENRKWIKYLTNRRIFLSDTLHADPSRLCRKDPREIHLLLGADVASQVYTGQIQKLPWKGIIALNTNFGWTLIGKNSATHSNTNMQRKSISALTLSSRVSDLKVSDLWRLEILGIMDKETDDAKNILEKETLNHFSNTIKRNEEGRFEVALPWVLDRENLPDNFNLAMKCLQRAERKLVDTHRREEYEQVFCEWEKNKIIDDLKIENFEGEGRKNKHYLPHRPVIKDSSETTKIRPVFNASARMGNSPSLNDCLNKGPNLLEIIPSILNRFRKYQIGVSADIEKAFLQISIRKEDRDFLRFLWRDAQDNLKFYRHNRVVFGLSSSPFLLAATINHLLDQTAEEYPETTRKLRSSFYVDNCLVSLETEQEVNKFIEESQKVLLMGKFNLRCWISNEPNNLIPKPESEVTLLLGMHWNTTDDTLSCRVDNFYDAEQKITKRKILSITQKVYDPIGFTTPVILVPKLILQETWNLKLLWDQELPPSLCKSFKSWHRKLHLLAEVRIPRWLTITSLNEDNLTLHVFCDASAHAYATCAFLRSESPDGIKVRFVNARSRVAPMKSLTIPRLELLACLIGGRLASTILDELKIPQIRPFLWTDSTTALAWIKKEDQWGTFVHNRVKEIRKLIEPSAWRHIPGHLNPADLPSRGCSAEHLLKSQWWEGPEFLKKGPNHWPRSNVEPNQELINTEKRKTVLSATNVNRETFSYFESISSYTKLIRITGWILRFLNNIKSKTPEKQTGNLSAKEIDHAEKVIIKKVQESLSDETMKHIQTFVDHEGLIRIKSKISHREDLENFRFPILLPAKHQIVEKLILAKHFELSHAGIQTMMSVLRENFWIIKNRKTVRQAIRNCTICNRFRSRPIEVLSPPLPADRTKEARIFQVTGVDLCGPLHLKDGSKSWIALFTCAIYRGVHLELLTSLSTECLMLALRRFIGRRGRPEVVYSDNGTNMVGVKNELKSINWEKIEEFANMKKIQWKLNPPSAPWWGGFWERMIGMVKRILRKVLGRACVGYEELNTILCDTESVINSRPLTYMSEDPQELIALTPSMFMQEIPETGITDFDQIDSRKINKRYQYRLKLCQDLRKRFRSEYLGQLKDSTKNCRETFVKEGDIVLIGDTNIKRINWPLAKIIKIHPGKDGKPRLVEVKTKTGVLLRPVQRLYPLEVRNDDVSLVPQPPPDKDSQLTVPCEPPDPDPGSKPVSNVPDESSAVVPDKRSSRGRLLKPPLKFRLTV